MLETEVLIIGGGATGTGIARDLALRGVPCILVEKNDINAGASGRNHGLLHSGARYASNDPDSAVECRLEGRILKKTAPHLIEQTGGLFAAVEGDDEDFIASFKKNCDTCGIKAKELTVKETLNLEPSLSDKLIAAYLVEDAAIDPFRLSLENIAHARSLGAKLFTNTEVFSFTLKNNRITSTTLIRRDLEETLEIKANQVINASGAWVDIIAEMAGLKLNSIYSKGSLLISQNRMTELVVNRLRKPGDADIIVPGGTVSIIGTTSERVASPEHVAPGTRDVDLIIREASALIPSIKGTRFIRAYSGVRPLVSASGDLDDRNIVRGFAVFDHEKEGIENFTSIAGGKLTTYRLMAEKTSDLVCGKLGNTNKCRTMYEKLPDTTDGKWTEPGSVPRLWFSSKTKNDPMLCECEMVTESVVDSVIQSIKKHKGRVCLRSTALRSRATKGPCQGTFCSLRIMSYMYDQGVFSGPEGLDDLEDLLGERWKGLHPLLWGKSMVQAELQEAVHCGMLGMELK